MSRPDHVYISSVMMRIDNIAHHHARIQHLGATRRAYASHLQEVVLTLLSRGQLTRRQVEHRGRRVVSAADDGAHGHSAAQSQARDGIGLAAELVVLEQRNLLMADAADDHGSRISSYSQL